MKLTKSLRENRIFCLMLGLVFVLIVSAQAKSSMAYFTTYTRAEGGHPVTLADTHTYIDEEFDNWEKTVSIQNTGEIPCYVRIRVLAGSQFDLTYVNESGKWTVADDGYIYYSDILAPGTATEKIVAHIDFNKDDIKEDFSVVVVKEACRVSYREDGTPYADWNKKLEDEK